MKQLTHLSAFFILAIFFLFAIGSENIGKVIKDVADDMPPAETPRFVSFGSYREFDGNIHKVKGGGEAIYNNTCIYLDRNHFFGRRNHPYDGMYLTFRHNRFTFLKLAYNDTDIPQTQMKYDQNWSLSLWCCPRPGDHQLGSELSNSDKIVWWTHGGAVETGNQNQVETTIGIFLGKNVSRYEKLKISTESINPNYTGLQKRSLPLEFQCITNENIQPLFKDFRIVAAGHKVDNVVSAGNPFVVFWDIEQDAELVEINGVGFNGWERVSNSGRRHIFQTPCNQTSTTYRIRYSFPSCNVSPYSPVTKSTNVSIEKYPRIRKFKPVNSSTFLENTPFTIEWATDAEYVEIFGDGITPGQLPGTGQITVTPSSLAIIPGTQNNQLCNGELRTYRLKATFGPNSCNRSHEERNIQVTIVANSSVYWFYHTCNLTRCSDFTVCARNSNEAKQIAQSYAGYVSGQQCNIEEGQCL